MAYIVSPLVDEEQTLSGDFCQFTIIGKRHPEDQWLCPETQEPLGGTQEGLLCMALSWLAVISVGVGLEEGLRSQHLNKFPDTVLAGTSGSWFESP